jgi:hypothetical protein
MVQVTCSIGGDEIENNFLCCAERRMIKMKLWELSKKGHRLHKFSTWLHRTCGTMKIFRHSGTMVSLPCVMCRKVIEKYRIDWVAFDGNTWVRGYDDPPSKPTSKQRNVLFKNSSSSRDPEPFSNCSRPSSAVLCA